MWDERLEKRDAKHHKAGLVGPASLRGTGPVNLVSTPVQNVKTSKLFHSLKLSSHRET